MLTTPTDARKPLLTAPDSSPSISPLVGDGPNALSDVLASLVKGADGKEVAGVAADFWVEIDRALSPVLGRRGVAALYKRSLHLSLPAHDWLMTLQNGPVSVIDFEKLKDAFAGQEPLEAASAAAELLRAFCDLLASLVGSSLTERLLRPVLTHVQAGSPPEARR